MWNIQVDDLHDKVKLVKLNGCHHDYALQIGNHTIFLTQKKLHELVGSINGNADGHSNGHANGSK